MAVPKAKTKAMTSGMYQRADSAWSHSKGKTDFVRRSSPKTIKMERMRNPRATQDVLGFRQAYMNLRLIPKSKIRKGAPMETMIGPQKIGTLVRSRRYPKMVMEGINGWFKVTPSQ